MSTAWSVDRFLHTVIITNKIIPGVLYDTASQIQQITYNQSHSHNPVSSQYIAPVTYSASLFIIAQH